MLNINIRKDVNAMKAIAVLAVVFYHLNSAWIKYGYLGVDIFFVISGFLITKIYLDKGSGGENAIVFLSKRVKRLFPALLFLLINIYIYALINIPPVSLKIIGHYIIFSLTFCANILDYLKGLDYYALKSNDNPLYHLWSLGLEFQFYIVIALFFLIHKGKSFVVVKRNFFFILLLSLLLWNFLYTSPSTRFYMLPFRLWEFLAGGIVAFTRLNIGRHNSWIKFLGAALLAGSLFVEFDFRDEFRLMLCVLGVVLFIACGPNTFRTEKLTLLDGVGIASYSLYLWHVPVQYVLAREIELGANLFYATYFCCLITVSFISYKFIESKYRYIVYSKNINIFFWSVSVLLISLGLAGSFNGGYPSRSALFYNLQQNNGFGLACNGNAAINERCAVSKNPKVAIVGNSYAMAFVKPLLERGVDLVQLTQDSCAIGYVDEVKSPLRKSCNEFYSEVVRQVRMNSFDFIILSSPFLRELSDENYMKSFLKIISEFKSSKIIVIGPTPRASFNVGDCMIKYRAADDRNCDFELNSDHFARIKKLRELLGVYSNVEFIDITDMICPNGHCYMTDGVDRPIYVDDGHLSMIGARKVLAGLRHINFN